MMDIRHPMTDFDLLMLDWAVASGMPMHILLTKADKLTYGAAKNTCSRCSRKSARAGATRDHPAVLGAQAPGLEEAYTVLADWMELADKGAQIAE
jgi:GTP-binding protein